MVQRAILRLSKPMLMRILPHTRALVIRRVQGWKPKGWPILMRSKPGLRPRAKVPVISSNPMVKSIARELGCYSSNPIENCHCSLGLGFWLMLWLNWKRAWFSSAHTMLEWLRESLDAVLAPVDHLVSIILMPPQNTESLAISGACEQSS